MKIATIVIRTLIGLLLLFASISYFFHLMDEPVQTGSMKIFNDGIAASHYLMPLVKTLELLCGLAFVSGKFIRLANIVILPITINILMVHICLMPEGIPLAAFLFLSNIFLIYRYWDSYKPILQA